MTDISTLNDQFAIAGNLVFEEGAGGMQFAQVRNQQATARICLQGAQLIEWAPLNEAPVIWLSKDARFSQGKSIRGGVPICWPWFGPHRTEAGFPAHGYARTVAWDVIATRAIPDGRTQIVFRLHENDTSQSLWGLDTPVECRITIGTQLDIELVTRNQQDESVSLTEALHTYFEVGDISRISILGLDNTEYLDKVDAGQRKMQHGVVTINSEVDRIYVATAASCIIDDPVLQRKIHIDKSGSQSTVVWNPWIEKANKMGDLGEQGYRHMVCVESGNAAENVVTLAPGETHTLSVSYRTEKTG